MRVDLNCDLGEGAGHDAELMPLITSANIACGAHAGDTATMRACVELAERHGVAIGAHPGFADRKTFGRREMSLDSGELRELVRKQIETLRAFGRVTHVKPHGALYNLAARDSRCAQDVVAAIASVDPSLVLFGLAGSELVRVGRGHGLRVIEEVFADRRYEPDGSLTPRSTSGAMITDEREAVAQVLQMVQHGTVRTSDGTKVQIFAETICLHGDAAGAVGFARTLRRELKAAGVGVRSYLP